MEDSDPLTIPLASAFSSVNSGLGESLVASSSGVRTQFEQSLSDSFHIGTTINNADGSLTSKNFGLNSCMYMENGLNNQCNYMNNDDDEEDEGLYLAINSMPLKVELEEESSFCEVKQEVEEAHYNADQLNDSSLLRGEQGIASTSGSEFCSGKFLPVENDMGIEMNLVAHNSVSENENKYDLKMCNRTEEEIRIIRQKNKEQKQSRRQQLKERILVETMHGIASDVVYDIHEIEGKKQRGEAITATEKFLLLKKKDRERQQKKRQNMTQEERAIERRKNCERKRLKRKLEKQVLVEALASGMENVEVNPKLHTASELTGQKIFERRSRDREYRRNRRKNMSEEQVTLEKQKNRERKQKQRQLEKACKTFSAFVGNVLESNL